MTESGMENRGSATSAAPPPYILFAVAGATYALPSHQVRHIEMVEEVTPVPNAASCVEGVVFSRGHVVPVINLRVRFGFERARRDLRTRLLVVEVAGRLVGLLADEAREFLSIHEGSIHPPSDAISGLSGDYLGGVATVGDRIVLILNLARVVDEVPSAGAPA
jgi:purine-binding chemotaxis protein CheW